MTELDRLPPDQRAVLSLVLDRGKSYAEVAAMLSIPETAVRARAHAALDALARASDTATPPPAAPPATAASAATPAPASPTAPSSTWRSSAAPPRNRQLPSSRLGGALLLGAIVVVAIVLAIVLGGGGKGSSGGGTSPTSTAAKTTGTSTTPASASAKINNRFALSGVEAESRASGEAYVLSDGSRHAFYVAAKNLPASHGFFYAVWLYNSPSSSAPLGRAPTVGSNGRLEGGGPLPSNAADYGKLIVTRETSTHATHPGTIVLSGSFSLG